ncbi:phosphatidylethanolamine-binding protein [Aspergillus oleicola]
MPDVSSYEATIQSLKDGTISALGVSIDSKAITLGTKLTKKETQSTPTLTLPPSLNGQDGTYTVIALDIDAPFVSWNALSPIVHWVQTDLKPTSAQEGEPTRLETTEAPVIPWLPAGPPPGAAPHRYVFFLYKQEKEIPGAMKGKGVARLSRMKFDLSKMLGELGLEGNVVAENWFVAN